jgi:hypothetical protein
MPNQLMRRRLGLAFGRLLCTDVRNGGSGHTPSKEISTFFRYAHEKYTLKAE